MIRKIFITIVVIIILAVISGFTWLGYFINGIFQPASDVPQEIVFTIEKGEGVNQISGNLKKAGLIKSKLNFEIWAWLKGMESKFLAGEHQLNTSFDIREITNVLTSGSHLSREREITIIEGWSIRDIAEYLEKEGLVKKEDLAKAVNNPSSLPSEVYSLLWDKPQSANFEGYLFPDTYRIFKDAEAEDVVNKMLKNFGNKLSPQMLLDIKGQNMSVYNVVTLASIVEKEVASEQDRRIVADIFLKRLRVGMPLQADSTVNFITGKKTTRASYADLEVDSLYNTYLYRGLPPGPICNPGLSAIRAVIYPLSNDYWYFLTTEEGKTIFSKTGREHLENKAKYLK